MHVYLHRSERVPLSHIPTVSWFFKLDQAAAWEKKEDEVACGCSPYVSGEHGARAREGTASRRSHLLRWLKTSAHSYHSYCRNERYFIGYQPSRTRIARIKNGKKLHNDYLHPQKKQPKNWILSALNSDASAAFVTQNRRSTFRTR